jgi:hypothetical protein
MAAKKPSTKKRSSKKEKPLQKVGMREVIFFKIANRRGYAAICRKHLTEGNTVFQAYDRLVKACKRSGMALPEKKASDLPKPK